MMELNSKLTELQKYLKYNKSFYLISYIVLFQTIEL